VQRGGTAYVSFLAAQRCRGVATQWIASGAVVVPTDRVKVQMDLFAKYLERPSFVQIDEPLVEPAVPPPRT
jgi:hypothetical protein